MVVNGIWKLPVEWEYKFPMIVQISNCNIDPNKRDEVMWKNSRGQLSNFSVKQAYKDLKNDEEKVIWSKLIWFTQNIPKHAFVLWLAVQKKLMTQDRVRMWGSYDLMVCPLCCKEMDSHNHLFFKCQYAEQIWEKVVMKMGVQCEKMDWEDIIKEFAGQFNGNSVGSIIRRLCLAASVYMIWQERNQRIFRDEYRRWEEVYEIILENIRLRLMSLKAKRSVAVLKAQEEWNVEFKKGW